MSVSCCLALFCFTKLLPCTAPYCPVLSPYGSAFGSSPFWCLYCRRFHSRLKGLLFCCPDSKFAPLYSKNKAMCWPAGDRTRFRCIPCRIIHPLCVRSLALPPRIFKVVYLQNYKQDDTFRKIGRKPFGRMASDRSEKECC